LFALSVTKITFHKNTLQTLDNHTVYEPISIPALEDPQI